MVKDAADDFRVIPSKTAVRKAGATVRRFVRDADLAEMQDHPLFNSAERVIDAYRSQFREPTRCMDEELRAICSMAGIEAQVSNRLKRLPTIYDKLIRLDGMDLSRMEDIGGCRIVTELYESLRSVHLAIRQRFEGYISRERDYISRPRESGYRAIHLIISEPDSGMKIEVQLRTSRMHDWAQLIESASRALAIDFKQEGAHPLQEFMKLESKRLAFIEGLGPNLTSREHQRMRKLKREVGEL